MSSLSWQAVEEIENAVFDAQVGVVGAAPQRLPIFVFVVVFGFVVVVVVARRTTNQP